VTPDMEDRRAAGRLVRAWLRGERYVFHEGYASERSTDGKSIFACYECVATRAPVPDQPIILLNCKRYQAYSNNGRTRRSVERALQRLRVRVIECLPDYAGMYSERDALLRTFYKHGLHGQDGTMREPREGSPERHGSSEQRPGARVLEFRKGGA